MKLAFFAILATLSLSVFADSRLEDSTGLYDCGGHVELRSYKNQGQTRYAIEFENVEKCSNVRIVATGKNYKITNKNGQFQKKVNYTLSNDAVSVARRSSGLRIIVESNSGATRDDVTVFLRGAAY